MRLLKAIVSAARPPLTVAELEGDAVFLHALGCQCHACAGIGGLKLKQVVHSGPVAAERIGRFHKLFGLAVIVVHRMLKASVPAGEYLMLSEPAFSAFGDFFGLEPEWRTVDLDGIGEQPMVVYYADQLASLQTEMDRLEGASVRPTPFQVLRWRLSLRVRVWLDAIM